MKNEKSTKKIASKNNEKVHFVVDKITRPRYYIIIPRQWSRGQKEPDMYYVFNTITDVANHVQSRLGTDEHVADELAPIVLGILRDRGYCYGDVVDADDMPDLFEVYESQYDTSEYSEA